MSSVLGKRARDSTTANAPRTPTKRRVIQLPTPETTPKRHGKSPSVGGSPYSPAKSVLRRSAAAGIVGREPELRTIRRFMSSDASILYVCGPPGTGKSATVTQYTTLSMRENEMAATYRVVNLNCVSLRKPELVYTQILSELGREGTSIADLRRYLVENPESNTLLVLDEVDYLSTGNAKTMYSLFELGQSRSNLKIIGIANALDLTDRMHPLLRRAGIEPVMLTFNPYTPDEITAILTARVSEIIVPATTRCLVEKSALTFLGRKVANATGDIRKALDILRKAIELVESEYRSALSSISNNTGAPTLAPVTIKHVSRVAAQALGGTASAERVSALAMHEKAVLCTIATYRTSTLETTFDAYVSVCKRDKMLSPLSRSEFATIVESLLDHSLLLHPTRSKQGSQKSPRKRFDAPDETIVLGVSEEDVKSATRNCLVLRGFLQSQQCSLLL